MALLKHLIAPTDADHRKVEAEAQDSDSPSPAGFDALIAKLRSINDADELSSFLHAPAFGYRPAWTPEERNLIHSRQRYLSRRKSGALTCNQYASSGKRQQNNGSTIPHREGESTDVPLVDRWEV